MCQPISGQDSVFLGIAAWGGRCLLFFPCFFAIHEEDDREDLGAGIAEIDWDE